MTKTKQIALGGVLAALAQSLPLEDRAVRGTARFYSQLRGYAAEMGSFAQVASAVSRKADDG